jgi:hypothetical protein
MARVHPMQAIRWANEADKPPCLACTCTGTIASAVYVQQGKCFPFLGIRSLGSSHMEAFRQSLAGATSAFGCKARLK